MTSSTAYQQWETVSRRVDQSLALAKLLRELFSTWENEHTLGTDYRLHGMAPMDLRSVTDLLTTELKQASDVLSDMEPCGEKAGDNVDLIRRPGG